MDRRNFVVALLATGLQPLVAMAQSPERVRRIAFVSNLPAPSMAIRLAALKSGLEDLGYREGKNLVIDYRYTDGKPELMPTVVAELSRLKTEVIITSGPSTTRSVTETNTAIPVVMGFDGDPVGSGYIKSLAHPGGNVTGLSALSPEISSKKLQLMKELVPRLSRIAVFTNSTTLGNAQTVIELSSAAKALGVRLQVLEVRDLKDLQSAFKETHQSRAEVLMVLENPVLTGNRSQVIQMAQRNRLPAMYAASEFVEEGGLVIYGVSTKDLFRRAANYVDKILKGAKPGDLPVEQPTKFEFVINLKTAKALGIRISQSLRMQADRLIE